MPNGHMRVVCLKKNNNNDNKNEKIKIVCFRTFVD